MSVVHVSKESVSGFCAGNGSVGGTDEVKVTDLSLPVTKHLVIRADSGNGADIKVGRPGDATNGFILHAGETSPNLYVENTDDVAIIAASGTQNFSWVKN